MNNQRFVIQAYVGKQKVNVSSHRLTFNYSSPGTAMLTVKAEPEKNAIVAIDMGWGESVKRTFIGFIERTTREAEGYTRIFCRELAAMLYHPLDVIIRHPTLMQTLSNVTEQTGLQFVVPERAYSQSAIPCFYSVGNGYRIMDEIEQAFSVPDLFWQQQGNGQIYVGSYQDSYWSSKPVSIPASIMQPHNGKKSAKLSCVPHVKPGALVNGRRLQKVEHTKTETVLEWM
ncbi:hypothetical protein EHW61_15475 [Salinivibrio sp. VYel6]|uniref:hypothetical protein n=1 Tax=Salinivibrio sp. VYel6 TaxID=2490493 RepID=UPI00128E1394|nr:hypothetical protein [Salinivibrio sp. VYel6]MPX98034.1 hypothetical protein [Salinivibrio sp. VYel6]